MRYFVVSTLSFTSFLISFAAFAGHVADVTALYLWPVPVATSAPPVGMAVNTSVCLMVLSIAVFLISFPNWVREIRKR